MPIPNPIAFTVFNLDIMWYGILIAFGITLATVIVYRRAPLHGIESERVLDFVLICVPVGVIGARLYFVLFNFEDYAGDFLKIINIRGGGLAIHGGLIFGVGVAILLCKLWHYNALNALDLAMPAVALAQAVGRWGNYFNSEAHGGPTSLPWAIMVDGQSVHPTFLYESVWCLFMFVILTVVDNKRRFNGQVFLLYGILYSVERFFVEYLRTDSLMLFGSIKQAMVLSALIFVIFLALYIVLSRRTRRDGMIFFGGTSKYTGKFKK